jgi:nitroimidazol reductase NimA-like FMN-containing flavoprotein (pyridoxamine 5'-phosphate oxidase superfamily)
MRVRRQDKEVPELAAVLDVLARGEVARIAMVTEDGPYVVPVSYAVLPAGDGEPLRIAVHGAQEGRKIEALRRDPRVCVEVTVDVAKLPAARACDVTFRYRSVIAFGRAVFLEEPAARARALAAIVDRYAPLPRIRSGGQAGTLPIDEAKARKIAILEIRLDSATCKVSPPPRATGKGA